MGPDEIKRNKIVLRPLHVSEILLTSFVQILISVLHLKQGLSVVLVSDSINF